MSGGANCPETPRQKMIGMMYLFLTAMLALNVSKSILNAFVIVNNSLEATNTAFETNNSNMYTTFENEKAKNPTKVQAYFDAAMKAQQLSKDMDAYVLELKAEIVAETEGITLEEAKELPLGGVNAKDNNVIPTHHLIGEKADGSTGKARELKIALDKYVSDLKKLFDPKAIDIPLKSSVITGLGNLGVETRDPQDIEELKGTINFSDNPEEKYWETSKFYHTPLAAVVTMFSQIQNQIRNAESTVVGLLLNSISASDFKFDTLAAKVIPNSNYIIQGDKYEADLFVAAFSTTDNPKIIVGEGYDTVKAELTGKIDTVPVNKGVGRLSVDASSTGPKKYSAIINVKKPDGTYKAYPLIVNGSHEIEYMVAKPSAVISPTKMNVLYVGVWNPLEISVAGYPADRVKPSGGLSGDGGPGKYKVKPTRAGKKTISVSVLDEDGTSRSMGSQEFRVKRVPDPVAKIAKKKGGKIKKNVLLAQAGVKADLENFDFDLTFRIVGFTVAVNVGGFEKTASSGSYRFTPQQVALMKKSKRGGRVTFENIRAKGPDGSVRKLGTVSFKIQ